MPPEVAGETRRYKGLGWGERLGKRFEIKEMSLTPGEVAGK